MADDEAGRKYVVRQGDTLLRLTVRFGLESVEDIRKHPKNAKLRAALDADTLPVMAELFIPKPQPPSVSVSPKAKNAFTVTVPMHVVVIAFSDRMGPMKNAKYELHGLAEDPVPGTLDATGTLRLEVPTAIESLRLVLVDKHISHTIWVGHLAPITQLPGVDARMAHLGYGPVGEKFGEPQTFMDATARAKTISVFQSALGLKATGFADETTCNKLKEKHGC